jgi:hypothetical protein
MPKNQTPPKPADTEQPTDEGLDGTICSPIFDTPETNRACCYVYDNDGPEYKNVAVWLRPWVKAEHARRLERERDRFKTALQEIVDGKHGAFVRAKNLLENSQDQERQ